MGQARKANRRRIGCRARACFWGLAAVALTTGCGPSTAPSLMLHRARPGTVPAYAYGHVVVAPTNAFPSDAVTEVLVDALRRFTNVEVDRARSVDEIIARVEGGLLPPDTGILVVRVDERHTWRIGEIPVQGTRCDWLGCVPSYDVVETRRASVVVTVEAEMVDPISRKMVGAWYDEALAEAASQHEYYRRAGSEERPGIEDRAIGVRALRLAGELADGLVRELRHREWSARLSVPRRRFPGPSGERLEEAVDDEDWAAVQRLTTRPSKDSVNPLRADALHLWAVARLLAAWDTEDLSVAVGDARRALATAMALAPAEPLHRAALDRLDRVAELVTRRGAVEQLEVVVARRRRGLPRPSS